MNKIQKPDYTNRLIGMVVILQKSALARLLHTLVVKSSIHALIKYPGKTFVCIYDESITLDLTKMRKHGHFAAFRASPG
jgi:hypothetical protein